MAAGRFSLFESLMIGKELEEAVVALSNRINKGADPAKAAARLAESYDVDVRDLVACYKNRYVTKKLNEAPIDDAVADLQSEGSDALDEIAADYGLNPTDLYNVYQRRMSRRADPEVVRRGEQRAQQEREKAAAERETRKAAGKKGYASKIANMVDRYADFYDVDPYKAGYAVAAKLRDQGQNLDAGDVDELYYQARGHYPRARLESEGEYPEKTKQGVVQILQDAAANQFPDGDPMDTAIPQIRRRFGADVAEDAAKIYRDYMGQDFSDYLADMWDQIEADTPEALPSGMTNPWR